MPTLVKGGENPRNQQEQLVDEQVRPNTDNNPDAESNIYNTPHASTGQKETGNPIATPTIVNPSVPVVVFIGPPSSGKSMILVRLAKYLRSKGYTIQTDSTFLNTEGYQRDCEEFSDKLNTNIALSGSVKFLLVKVFYHGREVAKLLEAPGEDFYTTDPMKIKAGKNNRIEPYLSTIMTSRNPKSYVVLLDLDSDVCFRKDS